LLFVLICEFLENWVRGRLLKDSNSPWEAIAFVHWEQKFRACSVQQGKKRSRILLRRAASSLIALRDD